MEPNTNSVKLHTYDKACDPKQKIFSKTKGFEIKTEGNSVLSVDFDDMNSIKTTYPMLKEIVTKPNIIEILTSVRILTTATSATTKTSTTTPTSTTTTTPTTATVTETLTIISTFAPNSLAPSTHASSTTSLTDTNEPFTIIEVFKSNISSDSNNSVKIFSTAYISNFLSEFINDKNDFFFIVYIIVLHTIILYKKRNEIENIWSNFFEKRKIQRALETQKILLSLERPIIIERGTDVFKPNKKAYASSAPIFEKKIINPPPYIPKSCNCNNKCARTTCPCRAAQVKCNYGCHAGRKPLICSNYSDLL